MKLRKSWKLLKKLHQTTTEHSAFNQRGELHVERIVFLS